MICPKWILTLALTDLLFRQKVVTSNVQGSVEMCIFWSSRNEWKPHQLMFAICNMQYAIFGRSDLYRHKVTPTLILTTSYYLSTLSLLVLHTRITCKNLLPNKLLIKQSIVLHQWLALHTPPDSVIVSSENHKHDNEFKLNLMICFYMWGQSQHLVTPTPLWPILLGCVCSLSSSWR